MNVKFYPVLLTSLILASCGGSGSSSDSSAPRTVQAKVQEPAELASLPADKRLTSITLAPLIGGVAGSISADVNLDPNTDRSAYNGQIASLSPSQYLMRIILSQPFDPSTVLVDGTVETGAVQNVVVAVDESPLEIVVGEEKIIVDTKPSDFSTKIDDDNDGLTNLQELLGTTDPTKADTDGDGVADGKDAFPNNSKEWNDKDGDGIGDNADNCPAVANKDQKDTNGNGIGDACDPDMDGDGLTNDQEKQLGTDPLKKDTDGDGVQDNRDNCPLIANADQANHGIHGLGDACDPDSDGDGILNGKDNCPFVANADQANHSAGSSGDACNPDIDNDGVLNGKDNCPFAANADQGDVNRNGKGDVCDSDADGDGLLNSEETTPGADGVITNWLVADTDGDGIPDNRDNCPITPNRDQAANGDSDGEGDACDCDPNDSNISTDKAVFVSTSGSDAATGARNDPVRTIQHGIQVAQATGKAQVYVAAGVYVENITMADGVSVYGGFALSSNGATCQKKIADTGVDINQTILTSNSGTTVTFSDILQETHLEGVVIESEATSGSPLLVAVTDSTSSSTNNVVIEDSYLLAPSISISSVTAVSITNASPLFVNDVVDAGNSQESTAVHLVNSPAPKFVHNTIRGGGSVTTSTVVESSGSVPAFVNNILFTDGGNSQRIFFFDESTPSASIVVKNNLLFGVQGTSLDHPKLYQDRSPSLRVYSTIAQVNSVDGNASGGAFDGNLRLTTDGTDATAALMVSDLLQDLSGNNYRLVSGSLAINQGLNPASAIGIQVLKDHDGTTRPQGTARDLGAFERTP